MKSREANAESVGYRLREELERYGWTVKEFIQRLGKHASVSGQTAIYKYVRGEGKIPPPIDFLEDAARTLGVRFAWLAIDEGGKTESDEESRIQRDIQAKAASTRRVFGSELESVVDEVGAHNKEHGGSLENVAKLESWARHGVQKNVSHLPILIEMAITEFVSSVYTTVGPGAFKESVEDQWSEEAARGDLRVSESDVTAYAATLTRPLSRLAETAPDWEKAAAVHSLLAFLYVSEFANAPTSPEVPEDEQSEAPDSS